MRKAIVNSISPVWHPTLESREAELWSAAGCLEHGTSLKGKGPKGGNVLSFHHTINPWDV